MSCFSPSYLRECLEGGSGLDGQVDLEPGLGRERGARGGLHVEPEAVQVLPGGGHAVEGRREAGVGVQEVRPGQHDRRVELARGNRELKTRKKNTFKHKIGNTKVSF